MSFRGASSVMNESHRFTTFCLIEFSVLKLNHDTMEQNSRARKANASYNSVRAIG